MDSLKVKKAPPKKGEEVPPSPEEIALKEKIESEKKRLEALGEWERFFDINEDKTKVASIRFPINDTVEVAFENEELFEFEDIINDEGGDFIYFSRNLPKEEEGAKKKAPAKG